MKKFFELHTQKINKAPISFWRLLIIEETATGLLFTDLLIFSTIF